MADSPADPEFLLRCRRKIQIVQLPSKQCLVQRPLGQRNLKLRSRSRSRKR